MNLIPLMLQTDSTRVVSLMIQDRTTACQTSLVCKSGHHPLSHHGQDPARISQLKIIESGILSTFSDFLTQLGQHIGTGKSRLLDHTAVLFGSNLGNANAHDPTNLPIILAGGGYQHGTLHCSRRRSQYATQQFVCEFAATNGCGVRPLRNK